MADTPFDTLYTAAKAIMADVNTAATETVLTQAPTNYGDDFRITPGAGMYQIQFTPEKDYPLSSNESYPRVVVTVRVHHYITSLANEESFSHNTLSHIADALLVGSVWQAKAGVYSFQPEIDPEMSGGEREGKVISFTIEASILMDAV
jgi:hypothetical protein